MSKLGLSLMSGVIALSVSSQVVLAQTSSVAPTNAQQTQNFVPDFRNRLDKIIKKLDRAQNYYRVQGPSAIDELAISDATVDLFQLLVEFGAVDIILGDSENAKYLRNIMNYYLTYKNYKSLVSKSVAGALMAAGVRAQPGRELRRSSSAGLSAGEIEALHVQATSYLNIVKLVRNSSVDAAEEAVTKYYKNNLNAQVLASNYVRALYADGVLGLNHAGRSNLALAIGFWFSSYMNKDIRRVYEAERNIYAALAETKNSGYYSNVMALLNRSPMKGGPRLRKFLAAIDNIDKHNKALSDTYLLGAAQVWFYAPMVYVK